MSFLQVTDMIIVGLAAIFGLVGLFKGLTKQIFSLIAIVAAVAAVIFLATPIMDWISGDASSLDTSTKCIYYVAIFVGVYIIVRIVGKVISHGADKSGLGFINKFLGMLWGVAKIAILACICLLLVEALMKIDFVNNLVSGWVDTTNKGWGVTVFLYENNFVTLIIDYLTSKGLF